MKKRIKLITGRLLAMLVVTAGLFSSSVIPAFAQSEAGVLFLLIAPGSRAGGMGEAGVAVTDDATAAYWNPGALGFLEDKELQKQASLMYVKWLPEFNLDLAYSYLSYSQFFEGIGTLGASLTFMDLGQQVITDENARELGTINSYDMALGLSYGTKFSETFSVGANIKYIYSKLAPPGLVNTGQNDDGIGSAMAVDLGLLKRDLFLKDLDLGATLTNLGPKISYVDANQADPLPTNFRLGLAYKLVNDEFNQFLVTYDISKQLVARETKKNKSDPTDTLGVDVVTPVYEAIFTSWFDEPFDREMRRFVHNIGFEYTYSNFIAFRSGAAMDPIGDLYGITFGLGLSYYLFKGDFSYYTKMPGVDDFNPQDGSIRFTLGFQF